MIPKHVFIAIVILLIAFAVAGFFITKTREVIIPEEILKEEIEENNTKVKELEELTLKLIETNELYQKAPLEQKEQAFSELQKIINERKLKMKKLAAEDPRAFLRLALPQNIRDAIPSNLANEIETEKVVQGRLEISHEDYPDRRSIYIRTIVTRDAKTYIFSPKELPTLSPLIEIKVKGIGVENVLVVPNPEEYGIK